MASNLIYESNEKLLEFFYQLNTAKQKILLNISNSIDSDSDSPNKYSFILSQLMDDVWLSMKYYDTFMNEINHLISDRIIIKGEQNIFVTTWLNSVVINVERDFISFSFGKELEPFFRFLNAQMVNGEIYVASFKSKYSARLYSLLKKLPKEEEVIFDLDELKTTIAEKESYDLYGNFKQRVLLPAKKEIIWTDLDFDFLELKEGKKVTKIAFNIKNKKPATAKKVSHIEGTPVERLTMDSFAANVVNATKEQGIKITTKTIDGWRKYGEENVLEAIESLKGKADVRFKIAYINAILENQKLDDSLYEQKDESEIVRNEITWETIAEFWNQTEITPEWMIERSFRKVASGRGLSEEEIKAYWQTKKDEIMAIIKKRRKEM